MTAEEAQPFEDAAQGELLDEDPELGLRRPLTRWQRALVSATVGVLGAGLGVALAPASDVEVGPLSGTVHLRPSLDPSTEFRLPPFGTVSFNTHRAPVTVVMRLQGVDVAAAEQLLYSQEAYEELEDGAAPAITRAAIRNAIVQIAFGTVGGGAMALLVHRRGWQALVGAGSALALTAASGALVGLTFEREQLSQPQFEGILSQAAMLLNLGQGGITDYANYREQTADIVSQVSGMYIAVENLPEGFDRAEVVTVLHVSDIHANPQSFDVMKELDAQFGVDLIIDTGDMVSWATPVENAVIQGMEGIDVPYVFVTGNHDSQRTAQIVGAHEGAHVLDNEVIEIEDLVIAGIGDPRFVGDDTSDGAGFAAGKDAVEGAGFQLGETIEAHNAEHPENPVDIALLHDPSRPAGLLGRTPLVLSGHMHTPKVEIDREGSGTDWLTSGSTGGALTSGGVEPVAEGEDPLDLNARLLYFDRESGELLAMDDITMGGLGLMSISVERTQRPTSPTELEVPEGAETPQEPIPADQRVTPGTPLPDDQRVRPETSASDGGGASDGGQG